MRAALVCLILLIAPLAPAALMFHGQAGVEISVPDRDAFYCQPMSTIYIAVNSSSGFGSEVADDIPAELAGSVIQALTLHVVEWEGNWINPDGIVINFYDGRCPPELDPELSFTFDWDDLDPVQVYDSSSWNAFRVHATLPQSVEIDADMSIGGYVLNNWGTNEPFCGLGLTNTGTWYGCSESWWDAPQWGYYRWTICTEYYGPAYDLAFCLEGGLTAAPSTAHYEPRLHVFPNPGSSLHFALDVGGSATLRIFDVGGRLCRTLLDVGNAVPARISWDGLDDSGRQLPAAVYLAVLEANGRRETARCVLLD